MWMVHCMQQGSCILCIPVGSPAAYRCALVQFSVGALQWMAVIKKDILLSPFFLLVYGSSDWWLFWCECSDDSASFLMQIWSFASSQADPFLLSVQANARPEMTLSGLNHLCAQGGDHRSTTSFSYVTAGDPVSCEQSILAFISCLYQCRSSDPGLVFLHLCLVEVFSPRWMTSRGLLSDWMALPPWMQFWASVCLMITSPVCFSLKASRQIFICFANSASLSWLLYLLSSVLTLC